MPGLLGESTDGQAGALNVLIVGAGIGGLTAGLALRQQGHNVTILESSKFSNETGAAIHIAPNCNGLLSRMGVDVAAIGGNEFTTMNLYAPSGKLLAQHDLKEANSIYQHKWLLVHRAHLHNALREHATGKEGKGRPCQLKLASKVVSVDPHNASVTLEDGERIAGDVLLGADGVHSECRNALPGSEKFKPYDGGDSAFRFLVPVEDLLNDPVTKDLVGAPGTLSINRASDRRIVMYPCVRNTLMNFLVIHPSNETRAADAGWNQRGEISKMLEVASCFSSEWKALLSKAPEESLKLWTLLDMDVLPTWTEGHMALLGDAAHPFLPHQAQGGAQAIEDAVSLAAVLPLGTSRAETPERLELYQKCRYERANRIQEHTRLSGMTAEEMKARDITYNPVECNLYNVNRDEYDFSTGALKKFLLAKKPLTRFRQPLSFGPSPGPRQPLNQAPDTFSYARQHQIVHSIRFMTSRTYLENLFPSDQFSFAGPATLVQASFICCSLKNMVWLGDAGYNHSGLYLHGVQYTKKNGDVLHGTFMPMLFESLADPIITGREELGMPKWFCDIDIAETPTSCKITMGWRGKVFGELDFEDLVDEDASTSNVTNDNNGTNGSSAKNGEKKHVVPKPTPDDGLLIYRYVPAVGQPGKTDAEYAVFDPWVVPAGTTDRGPGLDSEQQQDGHVPSQQSKFSTKGATSTKIARKPNVKFQAGDWKSLPTIHHIAEGLAGVPVYEILEAKVEFVTQVGDTRGARRVE